MDESNPRPGSEEKNMAATSPAQEPASPARAAGVRTGAVTWLEYVRRVAAGDQAALASLYDESGSVIYGFAMRMLGDPAEAEEVTLEVYMQVWRSAASFDAKRGTVFTWLVMLTRSRAIDRLRSARTRRRAEEPIQETNEFPDPGHSPECATWISERRSKVQAAVNALPPDQRQAIELAFFDGLSHGELAERLGQPVGTVKTRIRLGMIKLRQALGPEAGL